MTEALNDPLVLGLLAAFGLTVLLMLVCVAWLRPTGALSSGLILVLVAGLKFRERDAAASLAGQADAQVMMELALYAALAVVIGVVALRLRNRFDERDRPRMLEGLLGAYVVWAMLSALWSLAPLLTLVRAAQLAVLYGCAALSVRALDPGRTLRILSSAFPVFVLGGALCGAAGWRMAADQGRFTWFAFPPVECGIYSGLALTLVLASRSAWPQLSRRHLIRLLPWIAAAALVAIQLATLSRGPLIASLAAIGVILLHRRSAFVRGAAAAAAVLALVAVSTLDTDRLLAGVAESDNPVASTLSRGQSADEVLGVSGRAELWSDLAPLMFARPLHGYGFQGSRSLTLEAAPWAGHAHNAVLQSQLDLGVTGVALLWPALFATALWWLMSRRQAGSDVRLWVSAAATFLVVNAFSSESPVGAPTFEILLVFACTAALDRVRLRSGSRFFVRAAAPARPGHAV